ncbi:MAG TPA: DUF4142 domain-containing protein [Gemmataceae bacterium]|nr:DUF4142 domain-containing protein [Gemmataceae bacterium]
MTFRTVAIALGVAMLATTAWLARADDKDQSKQGLSDEQFVAAASEVDMAEIALGEMAAQQAGNDAVKKFANKMVQDHSMSSEKLIAIANKKGFKPAARLSAKHDELMKELSKLNGPQFDKDYMTHMVSGHQKAVELYTYESKNGKDMDLKDFASKTLPVVQSHLQMAEEITGQKGGKRQER